MSAQQIAEMMAAIASLEETVKGLSRDVRDLMDDRKWVGRLVLGAVIMAVLGLVLNSSINGT